MQLESTIMSLTFQGFLIIYWFTDMFKSIYNSKRKIHFLHVVHYTRNCFTILSSYLVSIYLMSKGRLWAKHLNSFAKVETNLTTISKWKLIVFGFLTGPILVMLVMLMYTKSFMSIGYGI